MSIESPLIGSGSQEEVDLRVNALIDLGKSRGFLTYEELNEKLPDEVVSPDKLDSLLMMIDEMGIKLIDEHDIGEFIKSPKARGNGQAKDKEAGKKKDKGGEPEVEAKEEDEEEFDLNLEEELD
jgi:RNA polymerase primary sigma factor